MSKTIDIIIPAYKPGKDFDKLLEILINQSVAPQKILVLQTVEENEEVMEAKYDNVEVVRIEKKDFDHGATRAYGASLSGSDYILFMTQDAIPYDNNLLKELLAGISKENVAICYGRQLPREEADILEVMAREHNYPGESRIQRKEDKEKYGIKTYFCSDVCAMYDKKIYDKMGGFVHPTIFNEDMIMASKVIEAGYYVYYNAKAKVIHSHSYTCMQQFHRNFDLGVSQKQYSEVFENISSEKEGAGFAKNTVLSLVKGFHFYKAFYFCLNCGFRLLGYRKGKNYQKYSKKKILRYTMNPGYWRDYSG